MTSTEILLHVNSSIDRRPSDLSTSQWTTYLKIPITPYQQGTVKLLLEQVEVPNVLTTFPEYARTFWWVHDAGGANILRSVSLDTTRIYFSGTDVANGLNALMTSAGYLLQFTFSENTAKLTLKNNESVSIRIVSSYRFSSDPYSQLSVDSIADRLGFNANYTSVILTAGSSVLASGFVRLLRTSCYYLTCDLVGSSVKQSVVPSPNGSGSILGRITTGGFGTLSQLPFASTVAFKCQSESAIDALVFTVLDDELQLIEDFAGAPVTFSLKIILS